MLSTESKEPVSRRGRLRCAEITVPAGAMPFCACKYLGNRRGVQSQFGQLLVGKLDINLFILNADEIDFLDILDAQDC